MTLTMTAGVFVAVLMAQTPAKSDLKIVTETNVTQTTQQAEAASKQADTASKQRAPQIETAYYKGEEARVEAPDGTVTIYDLAADKVYTLNPTDRTYHVAPIKQFLEKGSDLSRQIS